MQTVDNLGPGDVQNVFQLDLPLVPLHLGVYQCGQKRNIQIAEGCLIGGDESLSQLEDKLGVHCALLLHGNHPIRHANLCPDALPLALGFLIGERTAIVTVLQLALGGQLDRVAVLALQLASFDM